MYPGGILTSECLHSLRSSSHADKLDVSEHLLQVVGPGAQGQVVEDVLAQLLDVRVHQPHLVPPLTPAGTGLSGLVNVNLLTSCEIPPLGRDHWYDRWT